MRKILSFVAAMFVALAVNAQELPSTDFAAPGYSCAADAAVLSGTATELSGKFYLDETASPHHIAWSDLSKQYTAVATWHFHASRACYVTVTLDLGPVIASNKHIFDVELHAANGDRLDTIAEGPNYTGDGFTNANVQKTLEGQILIPAAGDYYIELRNNRDWCKGSIKNVILTYAADAPVIGAPAYYLVGTMNNWTPDEAYKFEENPGAEGEYMLTAALTVGDEIKVKGIVGATETWYPAGTGNNYVVDADHAGEWKKIYFRPEGQGGEDWHYGFFFVEENPAPVVEFDTIYTWYGKRGESTATEAIEKGGVATAEGGNSNIVVGTAQKTNWTIKLNKGFSNANYVGITLNEALKAGDQMQLAAFIASDNTAVLGIDFSESKEAASTDCQLLFSDLQLISTNAAPEDTLFTIPAAAAGAKYIRVYRNSGQTGVYIANITILRNADTPEPPAPQPQGCDWDNIEFLGDGSIEQTYANQFKVCKDGDVPNFVNIQTPGFATGTGIYATFQDAVIGNISLAADQYKIEGAGVIFYLTAFTAKETEVTVQWQDGVYSFTVLNVNGTEPQPHSYTVAGAPATLFINEWDPEVIENDLEPIVGGDYTHAWGKDSVTLAAGKVEFKIVEDHAWDVAYPAQNYELPIAENAIYNIAIFFNDQTKAVYAEATKVGDLPLPEGITCDSVYNLAKNDTAALAPVVVTYVNGKNVWVKDETAGMLLYLPANATWKAGNILTGVEGVVDIFNDLYEVKPNATQVAAVTVDSAAAPAPEVLDSVTVKDMNKYILLEDIAVNGTFTTTGSNESINILEGKVALFNKFKQAYAFDSTKTYDVVGVVSIYKGALQVNFISAEEHIVIGAPDYYLAGSMNGWAANEAYKFEEVPGSEGEYMLTVNLALNDEFKVIGVVGPSITWYPDGMGNNYKVDADHAGEAKKVYFRPEGGQEGWYAGFFFVEENQVPADTIPTTAPAVPTAAEDDVMAIYCNHYTTNNLHFEILGWGGVTTWKADTIDGTAIVYCADMKYEFLTNWGAASYDMSAYKKLHADLWAPAASTIRLGIEALGVNDGGSGFKSGVVCTLAKGWNSIDIEFSQVPDLANYSFTDVKYIFFEWYKTPEGESFENNPFGFANIYFYDKKAEGFENIDASVKAVKVLQNGQIFILRGDKVYTVTGQPIAK